MGPAVGRYLGLRRGQFAHGAVGAGDGAAADDRRAGDDQGGSGFIEQGLVGFVDDGSVQGALNLRVQGGGQSVAQEVEGELPQGAVHNPVRVGGAPFRGGHVVQHRPDG